MDASTLRIVENGLVPVYEGKDRQHSVNARELHGFLESGWDFSNWIQDRVTKYGFTEDLDFSRESLKTPTGGRPRTEYWLTLECAKEIAMVENNERGRQVRRYFIEVERQARRMVPAQHQIPKTYAEALRLAADQSELIEEQKAAIALMEPKAEFFDRVADSNDTQSVQDVAKVLGTGEIRLFKWLRAEKILMNDNRPYQEYLDRAYFKVIEQNFTDAKGRERLNMKTLVTGKGLTYLQQRFHGQNECKVLTLRTAR